MSPDMTILTMSKGVSVVNVCTDRLRGLVMGVDHSPQIEKKSNRYSGFPGGRLGALVF